MRSEKNRLAVLSLIECLCLVVLIWGFPVPPCSAKDPPTINDLLKSGEIDESYAEDGVLPEAPKPLPPTEPASHPAVANPAEIAPPQVSVGKPQDPFAGKVVLIGRPPYIGAKGMMMAVHGLIGFLREEMRVKDVRLVTPKDYVGVLRALASGTIDFAWLGPTAYVMGAERIPMIPLAKAKRRTGAKYFGLIVARKDSGIKRLEDIKDKVIGFVDPESASGYLYPLKVLLDARIDPQRDCLKVVFLQKHDAVLAAVWAKKIDVGAVIEDSIATIQDRKILDQIVVLGKTAEIPTDIVACRKDTNPILRERLKAALMKTGTLRQIPLSSSGLPPIMEFLPVDQAEIDSVKIFLKALIALRRTTGGQGKTR